MDALFGTSELRQCPIFDISHKLPMVRLKICAMFYFRNASVQCSERCLWNVCIICNLLRDKSESSRTRYACENAVPRNLFATSVTLRCSK